MWIAIEGTMTIDVRVELVAAAVAVTAAFAFCGHACAAPRQLNCVLTDTEAHPRSENRPITVVFDDAAKTLTAKDGDRTYTFSKVSISNVTISGLDDNVSVGIDRSSFGIVWQQYAANRVTTEYGRCRPAA